MIIYAGACMKTSFINAEYIARAAMVVVGVFGTVVNRRFFPQQ
jgi:hypothetical protein